MGEVAKPFTFLDSKNKARKPREAVDIAARYLVYKLHVPDRSLGVSSWQLLSILNETAATIDRAVEHGWVILRDEGQGKMRKRYAALTEEGRMLARKALR